MKKIIIIAAIFLLGFFVRADTVTNQNNFYYVFHLYKNNLNQLVADRDFKFAYDIIPGNFVQPPVGQFPYRGEIINFAGAIAANFKFDVSPGKISVLAPFLPDSQKAVFYDLQDLPVLTIPVSESSFCNDDGICNADMGEDTQTCPKDCKQVLPSAVPTTTPVTAPTGSSGIISGVTYAVIGLLLLGGAWWFFKRRGSNNMTLPPSLPTPPPPPPPNNPV